MRTLLLAVVLVCGTYAQPAFEAASLKPNKSFSGNSNSNTRPDNIEMKNVSLRDMLVDAYEIKDYQLIGPDWLSSERFDLVAKAPLGTGDDEKLMPLLRTLLIERFKLQTHRETRELPCFGLVVNKGGLKLKEVEKGPSSMSHSSDDGGGKLTAQRVTMDGIAEWLSREVSRPVLDMTELKGWYDFTLKYSKERARGTTDTPTHPVVSLAIQEELGLRLERRTAPVEVVVIDHVEKVPVEN